MTVAFEVREWIGRSPEEVWARLTDWERAPDWMAGIDAMSAEGPTAVGTALAFEARGARRSSEISSLDPGRAVTLCSRQGPVTANYSYRCSPEAGGTALTLVADCQIRGPLGLLGPLLRWLIRRSDGGQLAALRAAMERERS